MSSSGSDAGDLCNLVIGKKYKLVRKLGAGTYGDIYVATDVPNEREQVAIKIESIDSPHATLYYETRIYKMFHAPDGFPDWKWCGQDLECGYNFMVLELLGPSLEQMFEFCGRQFSLKTVVMMLGERVEFLHSKSFVHRDIKPDNFLMGFGQNRRKVSED